MSEIEKLVSVLSEGLVGNKSENQSDEDVEAVLEVKGLTEYSELERVDSLALRRGASFRLRQQVVFRRFGDAPKCRRLHETTPRHGL